MKQRDALSKNDDNGMTVFQVSASWNSQTLVFYVAVAVLSVLLLYLPVYVRQSDRSQGGPSLVGFGASAGLLIAFKGLSLNPTDVSNGYYYNFESADSWSSYRDQTVEPGFRAITLMVHGLSENYEHFLIILAAATLLPIYYVVWKWRAYISPGAAIAAYSLMFLMPSMSPLRSALAASIGLLAFNAMVHSRARAATLLSIAACTIHVTGGVFVLFVLLWGLRSYPKVVACLIAVTVAAMLYMRDYLSLLFVGRYSIYSISDAETLGYGVVVRYVPLLLAFLLFEQDAKRNFREEWVNRYFFSFVYVICAFSFELLANWISIFGRMTVLMLPTIIFVGCLGKCISPYDAKKCGVMLLLFAGLAVRFWMYLEYYYELESLMPYVSSLGYII